MRDATSAAMPGEVAGHRLQGPALGEALQPPHLRLGGRRSRLGGRRVGPQGGADHENSEGRGHERGEVAGGELPAVGRARLGLRHGPSMLAEDGEGHARSCRRHQAEPPSRRSRLKAALMSARWVKAWGKFPSASPEAPTCSE